MILPRLPAENNRCLVLDPTISRRSLTTLKKYELSQSGCDILRVADVVLDRPAVSSSLNDKGREASRAHQNASYVVHNRGPKCRVRFH